MLKLFETVRVLHLEPTDVCQAACPLCARETDSNFNKDVKHYITPADIRRVLPDHVIYRLDKMFMCGNYGDPAASEALAIIDHFRNINSSITIGMNTNGGIQAAWWWQALGEKLTNPLDYVVFSIDGLEDTNHIYRKNVVWNRVMTNVEAFIEAGGNAQWDMLVYEHNEHQVDACEQLARDMGFKWFRAKVSKRVPTVDWLHPPRGWTRPIIQSGPINCFRNNDQSLYLSARGIFHPCCWLGVTDYTVDDFDHIASTWNTDRCNSTCQSTCSTVNNMSNFTGQWQRNVALC